MEIKQRLAFEMYKMFSRYHNIDGRYRETKEFKRFFKVAIYEILKNNEHAAPIIHQALRYIFRIIYQSWRVQTNTVCFATCILEKSLSY